MQPMLHPLSSAAVGESPRLLLVGIDHRCAPLELREKVSFKSEDGQELMRRLVALPEVREVVLLSTCNRTELYLLPEEEASGYRLAMSEVFLARAPEIESEGRFYVKRGVEAAQHLFEVASGLQSMVLGEPEILGQVKHAAASSRGCRSSGTVLRQLLKRAIAAGGRVRRETALGAGSVSFGYAVIDLARNIFSQLDSCKVLLIGAGEMSRQVARSFKEKGARHLAVCNRGTARLEAFHALFPEAHTVPYEERHARVSEYDVVVTSTGADEPVFLHADMRRAMQERKSRPMLAVDLGVPRNIEPRCGELENLFLQDIDSLEHLIHQNLRRRREEVPRVQEILERELQRFQDWNRSLAAEPVIGSLQRWAEGIRQRELEVARKRWPEEMVAEVDAMTRSLVRKLLHHPSLELRSGGDPESLQWAQRLFRLQDPAALLEGASDGSDADDADEGDEGASAVGKIPTGGGGETGER